jgi:hypothetical protein
LQPAGQLAHCVQQARHRRLHLPASENKKMAGNFRINTCFYGCQRNGGKIRNNEPRGSSKNQWRENSTAHATTEVKEMAGQSETVKLVDHQKINGGKIQLHVKQQK